MNYFILFFIAMVLSFALTPIVKRLAVKLDIIDVPKDERRVHNRPIPLIGGLAIYISFTVMLIVTGIFTKEKLAILIGETIILIGGLLDDKYDLKPIQKLIFQISGALVLIFMGVEISLLTNPFTKYISFMNLEKWLSIPVTLFWIVGVTNAFNLIDGLDGLSSGLALISSVSMLIVSMITGRDESVLLNSILSGAILGFLPYNFNPASIFLGDTGAQLLGFLLSSIAIIGAVKSATAITLAVPIIVLGVPIYDTAFAIIRRKINGKPIMQADKGHIHHRLLALGFSQKKVVIIMYLISGSLGLISILASTMSSKASYIFMITIIIILSIIAIKLGLIKNRD
ncbi:MAG: undecaprenyl/decaprenyl-phosphate alpha-N-acetylglucosaminyl 1-phosphate transferase [Bacillota bacterium]|nr:undecaprenyl/decaprenyl-phosphate alpha-N-acetylglucosaminyl 1-phosphate transferase [Bacillota bacterium]